MNTSLGRIFDIIAGIGTIAIISILVKSRNTSQIIKASGDAYSNALRTAMGG